jgi:hypothetical protein
MPRSAPADGAADRWPHWRGWLGEVFGALEQPSRLTSAVADGTGRDNLGHSCHDQGHPADRGEVEVLAVEEGRRGRHLRRCPPQARFAIGGRPLRAGILASASANPTSQPETTSVER